MPLLDIAISRPCSCFLNNIIAFRPEFVLRKRIVVGNDRRLVLASTFPGRSFCNGGKVGGDFTSRRAGVWRGRLMIKAVGTLEIASVPFKSGGVKRLQNVLMMDVDSVRLNSTEIEPPRSSSEDSTDMDERERLRRMRISKANKGNTPWNKGKKHSPETLRRIKERTRLAMQNPKVKAKLINLGHAQSEKTRLKIGAGVRLGWEKRREKLKIQDTCFYNWQNLIAETARKGLQGEEQLEWDSYKILDKELQQQWQQSVEKRKSLPRLKGSKRAPKSAEQKRKISEAIAAKWADPEYRTRVYSGLARYHGIPEGTEWKRKRKPPGERQTQNRGRKDKDENDDARKTKSINQQIRVKRSKAPLYKDPLASTKLEMLKKIRAKRAAAVDDPKTEAVMKAKSLIAEAEKAAKALEIAAKTSPLAHASLMESRMLIAEAHKLIESIESEDATASVEGEKVIQNLENKTYADKGNLELIKPMKVNGVHSISEDLEETDSFSFDEFIFADFINGSSNGSSPYSLETEATGPNGSVSSVLDGMINGSGSAKISAVHKPNPNGISAHKQTPAVNWLEPENEVAAKREANVIKKWIRGRFVEVVEEEEEEEEEAA
ncbi:hypothetical protein AAHA92_26828 [Salvia divinorum]|uniref:Nuclease associated modular domain-containing protein n=1 Tax=Salvia divinorum TaxID=28513 RepID=A0ABD1G1R4_SALDI